MVYRLYGFSPNYLSTWFRTLPGSTVKKKKWHYHSPPKYEYGFLAFHGVGTADHNSYCLRPKHVYVKQLLIHKLFQTRTETLGYCTTRVYRSNTCNKLMLHMYSDHRVRFVIHRRRWLRSEITRDADPPEKNTTFLADTITSLLYRTDSFHR